MDEVGNRAVTKSEGTLELTERNKNKMNGLQAAEAPPRPNLTTQQSSSLPSTPYIHARELQGSYRTPSPINRNVDTSSPRTARSESDGTLRPPGRTPFLTGCKYETGMTRSRRRIPYSLGSDKLESSPTKVKKHLDPAEEGKLSGDMRELYDRLLPSKESEDRRVRFVRKLETILNDRWPGNDIKVHVFGSSGNLLCTSDSDVDICITTPMRALERTCLLARALGEHGMQNVVCVPHAKVPIVKIWDPELKLACDMNVNNTAALNNTRMIKAYVQVDPRVRQLAMIVKHWTRRRILNDAAFGGTLSSYTWICMIINFLQTRNPKILPNLQQPPLYDPSSSNDKGLKFNDDLKSLQGFGRDNKESLGDLLFGFFRRYGHEINYEREVVSVREGGLISKQSKKWHLLQNNRLGVEEPFNIERNLGNTADDNAFRGIHLELRRAFDLVSQGRLAECCEEYEFPTHEEKFWSKPPSQPRPILTRSQSQSGRPVKGGSSNGKGASSGQRNRSGTSNRRASSAAAMNKMPMYQPVVNGDRNLSSNQIHDHLFHHYQMLQQQEQQLRLQMHQRAQATLHAQVTAQIQQQPLQVYPVPYAQQANSDSHRRHSNVEPPPLSAPLRSVQAYYFPVPALEQSPIHSLSPSLPASQNTTSPSSPSQASAQLVPADMRRSAHRSTAADNAALRSHSQPPANMKVYTQTGQTGLQTPFQHTTVQGSLQKFSTLQQYQQAYLQSRRAGTFPTTPDPSEAVPIFYDPLAHESIGREYLAYQREMKPVDIPPDFGSGAEKYSASSQRARTVSPNLSRLGRQSSRSPSPSRSAVSTGYSINFYSSESPPFEQYSRGMMGDGKSQSSGPVIVDGSSDASEYATPPENVFYPTSSGPASTNSDDRAMDTPTSEAAITPTAEASDPFLLNGRVERSARTHTTGVLQFGEMPARATFRSTQTESPATSKAQEKVPTKSVKDTLLARSLNGLGIEVNTSKAFDKSLQNHNMAQKPTHHSPTLSGLNLASTLKPPATLSPVREVRTPSPSTTRNQNSSSDRGHKALSARPPASTGHKEVGPSPLAESSSASTNSKGAEDALLESEPSKAALAKGKEGHTLPNGAPPKSPSKAPQHDQQQSQQKPAQAMQSSGWQQSTKKKKKNKKSASVGSAPIPQDPNERKGG